MCTKYVLYARPKPNVMVCLEKRLRIAKGAQHPKWSMCMLHGVHVGPWLRLVSVVRANARIVPLAHVMNLTLVRFTLFVHVGNGRVMGMRVRRLSFVPRVGQPMILV